MSSPQKTLFLILASLAGGFWISVLRYYGAYTYLKAPPIHNNIKLSHTSRITDNDLVELNKTNIKSVHISSIADLAEGHKRNMKSRHISRSSLSFCNDGSNDKSKGISTLGSENHLRINMYLYNNLRLNLLQMAIYFTRLWWEKYFERPTTRVF